MPVEDRRLDEAADIGAAVTGWRFDVLVV